MRTGSTAVARAGSAGAWQIRERLQAVERLTASSSCAVITLVVLTLAIRVPFRIGVLDHWDSVQYALGLHNFNVAVHTPHPPGSPLYLLLGRGLFAVLNDEHQAFVVLSFAASAGAVALVYLLGRSAYGPWEGWIASLALATQPPFWTYGADGNSWTQLAFWSALAGLACLALLRSHRHAIWYSAVVLGVASGFRLDVTVFLAPAWVWCACKGERSKSRRLLAALIIATCVVAWLIPVVQLTPGGFGRWMTSYIAMFMPTAGEKDIARVLVTNTAVVWVYLVALFGPMVVLSSRALLADLRSIRTAGPDLRIFFLLWVLPSFVFLWLLDTTEAGHMLLLTEGLLPPAAALVVRGIQAKWIRVAAVAAIVAGQAIVFLFAAPRTQGPGTFIANSSLQRYTVAALRRHERDVAEMRTVVREDYDPAHTLIATRFGQSPFRFAMFYLPEYPVLRVSEPGGSMTLAQSDRAEVLSPTTCLDTTVVTSIVWVNEVAGEAWQITGKSTAGDSQPLPGIENCQADERLDPRSE